MTERIEICHGLTLVMTRTKPAVHALNTAEGQKKLIVMFQKVK